MKILFCSRHNPNTDQWETKAFNIDEWGEAKEWVMKTDRKWIDLEHVIQEIEVPTEEILMKDFLNEHFCYSQE